MTERDVRDLLTRHFEGIAEKYGVRRSYSHACALEILAALAGQGIQLVRPVHQHDPAADWRRVPEPGDAEAGAAAARAALYQQRPNGEGVCPLCRTVQPLTAAGRIVDHDLDDDDMPPAGCLGAGLEPAAPERTTT